MSSSCTTEMNYSSNSSDDDNGLLTPQLQTLQRLVPNISQTTNERSILEETWDYLRRILEETERIEKELLHPSSENFATSSSSSGNQSSSAAGSTTQRLQILRVETEKIMKGKFVVKIVWKKGSGAAGEVQRVIESCLDVKMTSIKVANFINPDEMLTTAFVQVKKQRRMTEEELHDLIVRRFRSRQT